MKLWGASMDALPSDPLLGLRQGPTERYALGARQLWGRWESGTNPAVPGKGLKHQHGIMENKLKGIHEVEEREGAPTH